MARIRKTKPDLVFKRKGLGGGYLVDISALPLEAQFEIARRKKSGAANSHDIADKEVFRAVLERVQRDIEFLLTHINSFKA